MWRMKCQVSRFLKEHWPRCMMVFPSVFLTGEFNLRPMGVWPLTAVTLPHRMLLYFGIASSIRHSGWFLNGRRQVIPKICSRICSRDMRYILRRRYRGR